MTYCQYLYDIKFKRFYKLLSFIDDQLILGFE